MDCWTGLYFQMLKETQKVWLNYGAAGRVPAALPATAFPEDTTLCSPLHWTSFTVHFCLLLSVSQWHDLSTASIRVSLVPSLQSVPHRQARRLDLQFTTCHQNVVYSLHRSSDTPMGPDETFRDECGIFNYRLAFAGKSVVFFYLYCVNVLRNALPVLLMSRMTQEMYQSKLWKIVIQNYTKALSCNKDNQKHTNKTCIWDWWLLWGMWT